MSASSIAETPVWIPCDGEDLLGILAKPGPDHTLRGLGVVIVVGGPQVRVGSHRQFVQLARSLAGHGWPVLRFDVRGMGDSTGVPRSFEQLTPDIAAAISTMRAQCGVRQVVLWGLCDGASAALLHAAEAQDPTVAGLCLLNPWVRSEASLARAHVKHYYLQRLMQPSFWRKLLRGGVAGEAIKGLLGNMRMALGATRAQPVAQQQDFPIRMAQGWRGFRGGVLLVLSGDDYTAKEFIDTASRHPAWAGLLTQRNVQRADLAGADHTFSGHDQRVALERLTANWLAQVERAAA